MNPEDQFYDDAAQVFEITEQLASHWVRHPEWETQVSQFSFFLRVTPDELNASGHEVRDGLVRPYMSEMKDDELHITVASIVSRHLCDDGKFGELVDASKTALTSVEPFSIQLGGVVGFDEGIAAAVRPWAQIRHMRERLRTAAVEVLGDELVLAKPLYTPHLTLAYAREAASTEEIRAFIRPFRHTLLGELKVSYVDLVELSRSDDHYRFTTIEKLPLGSRIVDCQVGH